MKGGVDFKWDVIDNTDYKNYSLIALGGYGLAAHYFMIIGVDTTKSYYLVTDQTLDIWIV